MSIPTVAVADVVAQASRMRGTTQVVDGHFVGTAAGGKIGAELARPRCPCPSILDPKATIQVRGPIAGVELLSAHGDPHAGGTGGELFGNVLLAGKVDVIDGVVSLTDASVLSRA